MAGGSNQACERARDPALASLSERAQASLSGGIGKQEACRQLQPSEGGNRRSLQQGMTWRRGRSERENEMA